MSDEEAQLIVNDHQRDFNTRRKHNLVALLVYFCVTMFIISVSPAYFIYLPDNWIYLAAIIVHSLLTLTNMMIGIGFWMVVYYSVIK